jgi:hypothetical protein
MHPEREIETEIVLGFESSPRDPLRRRRSETVWFSLSEKDTAASIFFNIIIAQ